MYKNNKRRVGGGGNKILERLESEKFSISLNDIRDNMKNSSGNLSLCIKGSSLLYVWRNCSYKKPSDTL